ncbi:MAG: transposase [Actinobacteria bacterium]|nr:transposase family protein [Chloroflexota bacterium]MBM4438257.1 transposase [Actinomycetota bacterium]
MAPGDSLARLRKRVLDRVSSGEVTVLRACREAGISCSRYYQLRRRYLAPGEAGLRPRPLTARTLAEVRAIERPRVMHIGSDTVGAEPFADTMYVGELKGVGTIWQYTMVDGACSFGFARVRGGRRSAKSMARFLEEDVLSAYREARIRLVRVNTDGGPEFGKAFSAKCRELGIEHRKLPPRSPDLNAFVERFQGSCLHLHYRTAFRFRYYLSAADIDADLAAWLRHYNLERPHRGYRTRGRTPARSSTRIDRACSR